MIFYLKCKCGATGTATGHEEDDTNAAIVQDEFTEWEGGSNDCQHEEYEIVESEHEQPEPDWGEFP